MSIRIEQNQHIGFFFDARSGSTVLRHYLSSILNYTNLTELFNMDLNELKIHINSENKVILNLPRFQTDNNLQEKRQYAKYYLDSLSVLSQAQKYSVFNIYLPSFIDDCPDIVKDLSLRKDVQYFHLKRADVLYAIISTFVSIEQNAFHNSESKKIKERIGNKFNIPISEIEKYLIWHVKKTQIIEKYFGHLPTIYYEQFQMKSMNMMNLFENIPKKIIDINLNKFKGNHKDFIVNLDEIENYYEEFVNDNAEYFPQYFNKLPEIKIPEYQGRQPRNLLAK
jgi:hypothetical protein